MSFTNKQVAAFLSSVAEILAVTDFWPGTITGDPELRELLREKIADSLDVDEDDEIVERLMNLRWNEIEDLQTGA